MRGKMENRQGQTETNLEKLKNPACVEGTFGSCLYLDLN